MPRLAAAIVVLATVIVVSGCSDPRPLPTPTSSATASEAGATGDGVLRIGTLFPMSGDVAVIGPAMVAAVEVAVRDINAAGGVLGQPVEVFYRDSGDAGQERLESAFAELVERGVDVVIGPASSSLLERLLPLADAADVTVISSAAAHPTVRDAAPPGVLFRTIPAVDQQANAIVRALAEQGEDTVALVTTGDALGLSFERATRAALEVEGMRLLSIEQLDAATNPDRLAFSVASSEPDAVVLATSSALAEQNQRVITALVERGVAGQRFWLTAQNLADYSSTVAPGLLEGANGVLEGAVASEEFVARLRQSDPALRGDRYSPETYDAVVLAALAAQLAGDDGGRSIAGELPRAAHGGVPCASYGECLEVLETEPEIDYQGLSGPLTVDGAGDIVDGEVGLFRYTVENRPERMGTLPIGAR